MADLKEKYEQIHRFLSTGEIPSGFDKSQRYTFRRACSKYSLKDGEVFFGARRVVKSKEQALALFREVHASPMGGHSGVTKTCSALSNRWYWRRMSIDITHWVQECEKCRKVEKPLKTPQNLQCIKVSTVWEFVGIDVYGPFPRTQEGCQYILAATDYFSKWVEAFPMKTKMATEVARHICSMIYRHGCPKRILTDQGREFVNQLNNRIRTLLGIERSVTVAYHPQANTIDENTNNIIKRALTELMNEKQNDWDNYLDATLFSFRSQIQSATNYSPFLLMYGREAILPSDIPVDLPASKLYCVDQ